MKELSEIDAAYSAMEVAVYEAVQECNYLHAAKVAESLGMVKLGDGKPSARHEWEKKYGDLTLWFQWRWYDQSHPFSMQPDMNKLKLELRQGGDAVRSMESSYED